MTETTRTTRKYMVSPKEAAAMLHVGPRTIRRMIKDGKIGASKLSAKTIRIRVADIEAYIEANKL